MATHAPITGAPTCAPFNPADWLSRFESLGGGYTLLSAGLHLCVPLNDHSDEQLAKAWRMVGEIDHEQTDALRRHLIAMAWLAPAEEAR